MSIITKYLIVISLDSVSTEDLEILGNLPNFSKLIKGGALIKNVETVYPSLTYPAHATIVTGKTPNNHGIINNTFLDINRDKPEWYWNSKNINGETLYDLAEKSGLKTCSILWPVTGRSKITYNMPEISCTRPWHNQIIRSLIAGSKKYQLIMNNRHGHLRKGITQPYLDNFATEVAKDTILRYKPNLMLLHLVDVDSHRHYTGCNSEQVLAAFERHDKRLGEIMNVLESEKILRDSTVVVLGDHSQLDCNKVVRINSIFKKNNLIRVNERGLIVSYDAISKSCDGSSYIYLRNKDDEECRKRVLAIIDELMLKDENPIEFFLNSEEAKEMGADSKCDFMLEGKKGYYFLDDFRGSFIEEINLDHIGKVTYRMKSAHGYSPKKKNYDTFFLAYGKGIKKGITLESGKLINHGNTLAKLLGLELKEGEGVVENRILDFRGII